MVLEHRETARHGILAGCGEQLVDESLLRVRRVRMADGAPPQYRHAHVHRAGSHTQVRHRVWEIAHAFGCGRIEAVRHHRLEGRSLDDRLPHDDMVPGRNFTLLIDYAAPP